MKKKVLCAIFVILLSASCGGKNAGSPAEALSAGGGASGSAIGGRDGQAARLLLERALPQAMADGVVKAAVLRNMPASEYTRQFLEGCVSEGRSMGFTVDTFVSGGDSERCRELAVKIAAADYDGLILSNGGEVFDYGSLAAHGNSFKIAAFDAPGQDELVPEGIACAVQDDEALARLSLEALVSFFDEKRETGQPVRVVRAWIGPGVLPLDRRQTVYEQFAREGKIAETALVSPRYLEYARSEAREAFAALLPGLAPGSVDAVWAAYDELAKGCADALAEAGRQDIKIFSIDISNDDLRMMLDHSGVWVCTAAVNPRFAGVITMRLLAAAIFGGETLETYRFEPQLVWTADLDRNVNMANIDLLVPDWAGEDGLLYPWMAELKAAGGKIIRKDSK